MKILLPVLILMIGTAASFAAPFVNLGFDDAITNRLTLFDSGAGWGPIGDLLPGWQVYHGNTLAEPSTLLNYDLFPPANDQITLISKLNQGNLHPFPVDGKYALYFSQADYSFVQRGDIPPDAQFLEVNTFGSVFRLSINGELLTPRPNNFGRVDISAYAGQNVELKLSTDLGFFTTRGFDSIRFTVPEPSSLSLALMGGAALLFGGGYRRWRS